MNITIVLLSDGSLIKIENEVYTHIDKYGSTNIYKNEEDEELQELLKTGVASQSGQYERLF